MIIGSFTTATGTSLNKKFNEQKNGGARFISLKQHEMNKFYIE